MSSEAFAQLASTTSLTSAARQAVFPNPQFARGEMEVWLPEAGVGYRRERRLSGFRRPAADSVNVALRHPSFRGFADYMGSSEFRTALGDVVREAERTTIAVMCIETVWRRCHRRLIADAAVLLYGARVQHLGHDGRLTDHRITDGARLGDATLVYDQGGSVR